MRFPSALLPCPKVLLLVTALARLAVATPSPKRQSSYRVWGSLHVYQVDSVQVGWLDRGAGHGNAYKMIYDNFGLPPSVESNQGTFYFIDQGEETNSEVLLYCNRCSSDGQYDLRVATWIGSAPSGDSGYSSVWYPVGGFEGVEPGTGSTTLTSGLESGSASYRWTLTRVDGSSPPMWTVTANLHDSNAEPISKPLAIYNDDYCTAEGTSEDCAVFYGSPTNGEVGSTTYLLQFVQTSIDSV